MNDDLISSNLTDPESLTSEIRLLPLLCNIIAPGYELQRSGGWDILVSQATDLVRLALIPGNRELMVAANCGLLPSIQDIIHNSNGSHRVKACQILCVLSTDAKNCVSMASLKSDLLTFLLNIIREDKGEVRLLICEILKNFSSVDEICNSMIPRDQEVLSILLNVIREDKGEARIQACSVLQNISIVDEICVCMGSPDLGILPVLLDVIRQDNGKSLTIACRVLWNMSYADANRIPMASPGIGLLSVLIDLIRKDKGKPRTYACVVLQNLACAAENKISMMSPDLNLLSTLLDVVRDSKDESRSRACIVLKNLSSVIENKIRIASPSLGLLPVLVDVIREDKGDARAKACDLLSNLSLVETNCLIMAFPNLGLLPILMETIREDFSDARVYAMVTLHHLLLSIPGDQSIISTLETQFVTTFSHAWYISEEDILEYLNTSPECGLLHLLVRSIASDKDGRRGTRALDLKVLSIVSDEMESKVYLGAPDISLLPILRDIITVTEGSEREDSILILFSLTVADSPSLAYMVSTELGLLPVLLNVLNSVVGSLRIDLCSLLWNLAEHSSVEVAMRLIESKVHFTLVNILFLAGPDPKFWVDDHPKKILCFLMNLARFDFTASAIKSTGVINFLNQLISIDTGSERLKSIFCLALTVGRDEHSSDQFTASDLVLLSDVFSNTLASKGGQGYILGTFCIKLVVSAILAVSTSDLNRQLLVNAPEILGMLISVLKMFSSNSEPIELCGGGGQDLEAIVATVETLLQLSFAFEDDRDLQNSYMTPNYDIPNLLKQCIDIPPTGGRAKLPVSSIRTANILLKRLSSKSSSSVPGSPIVKYSGSRHVMVSYAWGTNKPLVVEFCTKLRILGADVWRDDDGSKVLQQMSGSTDDRMAEAIERSEAVIIFVSRSYKVSANCRAEAGYAHDLFKQGKLRLMFVMLEEDYHTRSSPDRVDAWLGLMIGSSLWYPMWEKGQVDSVAQSIFQLLQTDQAVLPPLPSTPGPLVAESVVGKIWSLIHDDKMMIDPSSMKIFLDSSGVLEKEMLNYCDEGAFQEMKMFLKPIPAKMFLKLVEEFNGIKL